jgi:hypothetical protein
VVPLEPARLRERAPHNTIAKPPRTIQITAVIASPRKFFFQKVRVPATSLAFLGFARSY